MASSHRGSVSGTRERLRSAGAARRRRAGGASPTGRRRARPPRRAQPHDPAVTVVAARARARARWCRRCPPGGTGCRAAPRAELLGGAGEPAQHEHAPRRIRALCRDELLRDEVQSVAQRRDERRCRRAGRAGRARGDFERACRDNGPARLGPPSLNPAVDPADRFLDQLCASPHTLGFLVRRAPRPGPARCSRGARPAVQEQPSTARSRSRDPLRVVEPVDAEQHGLEPELAPGADEPAHCVPRQRGHLASRFRCVHGDGMHPSAPDPAAPAEVWTAPSTMDAPGHEIAHAPEEVPDR